MTPSQQANKTRKANRKLGLARNRAINGAQNQKDFEAASLRRRAAAVPGTDRAPALARAFREVQAGKAAA